MSPVESSFKPSSPALRPPLRSKMGSFACRRLSRQATTQRQTLRVEDPASEGRDDSLAHVRLASFASLVQHSCGRARAAASDFGVTIRSREAPLHPESISHLRAPC
jgi:hypothetical protein